MTDSVEQFTQAMRSAGLDPDETPIADGVLHRIHDKQDKAGKKDLWYILFEDGIPAGSFGHWSRLPDGQNWQAKADSTLTPQERTQIRERRELARAAREVASLEVRAACVIKANKMLEAAGDAKTDHPYLVNKNVKPYGARQLKDLLLIPVSKGKILTGLQIITPDGSKKFLTGTEKAGAYLAIKGKGKTVYLVEGWATGCTIHELTGATVIVSFDCGNLEAVSKEIRAKGPNYDMVMVADNDRLTAGNPGLTKATAAALAIGARLAIPSFPGEDGTDANDLHAISGKEAVKSCLEAASMVEPIPMHAPDGETAAEPCTKSGNPLTDAVIRLAELSPLQYDKVRKDEAKKLGVQLRTLDAAVKDLQKTEVNNSPFEEVEPWPESVDGSELLTGLTNTIRRFIICEQHTADAAALWIVMTWFMDAVQIAPLAVITAPEKRCGKTMLLTLIGKLVPRPLTSSSISPSALFRSIDLWQPTILVDETDACLKENEELRGLINCGHTRDSAYTIRCTGDDHLPTRFNLWGAKALSGIGHVAETIMDRSILLELRRKLSHETVDRIRHAEPNLFAELRSRLARFSDDNLEHVRKARPNLPNSLNDRAQDNWEPLLSIALVAGGDWFNVAVASALKLSGGEALSQSIGAELLADIQEIFEHNKIDRISTADLIKAICADDEKMWATYNRGFPISPKQMAAKLKGYGIHSNTIRIGTTIIKGYEKDHFSEAFKRYIPEPSDLPLQPVTTLQPASIEALNVTDGLSVTDTDVTQYVTDVTDEPLCYANGSVPVTPEPASIGTCNVVTDKSPLSAVDVIDLTGIGFEVVS